MGKVCAATWHVSEDVPEADGVAALRRMMEYHGMSVIAVQGVADVLRQNMLRHAVSGTTWVVYGGDGYADNDCEALLMDSAVWERWGDPSGEIVLRRTRVEPGPGGRYVPTRWLRGIRVKHRPTSVLCTWMVTSMPWGAVDGRRFVDDASHRAKAWRTQMRNLCVLAKRMEGLGTRFVGANWGADARFSGMDPLRAQMHLAWEDHPPRRNSVPPSHEDRWPDGWASDLPAESATVLAGYPGDHDPAVAGWRVRKVG